jgi:hypothetical protein
MHTSSNICGIAWVYEIALHSALATPGALSMLGTFRRSASTPPVRPEGDRRRRSPCPLLLRRLPGAGAIARASVGGCHVPHLQRISGAVRGGSAAGCVDAIGPLAGGFLIAANDNQPRAKCSARAIRARCVRQDHSAGRGPDQLWGPLIGGSLGAHYAPSAIPLQRPQPGGKSMSDRPANGRSLAKSQMTASPSFGSHGARTTATASRCSRSRSN